MVLIRNGRESLITGVITSVVALMGTTERGRKGGWSLEGVDFIE
jgi:hypothetical protein